MKKLFIHFLLFSFFVFLPNVMCASAYEEALKTRFEGCVTAIENNNFTDFERQFCEELLTKSYFEESGSSLPVMKPVSLAVLAARSKKTESLKILEYMLQKGLNPNFTEVFSHQEYEVLRSDHIVRLTSWNGTVRSLLPLDEAVYAGNVPAVTLLLEKGADPYQTTIDRSGTTFILFLKQYFPSLGETPLKHAQDCMKLAKSDNALLPGTVYEYCNIIKLLKDAEVQADIESCEIL